MGVLRPSGGANAVAGWWSTDLLDEPRRYLADRLRAGFPCVDFGNHDCSDANTVDAGLRVQLESRWVAR